MENKVKDQLLQKAYYYLSIRSRTEKEMRSYLEKKNKELNGDDTHIELILAYLKDLNFINDKTFIESFIHQRSSIKPKGAYILRQELKQKGISSELIDEYLNSNEINEVDLAFQALASKWRSVAHLDKPTRFRRALQFLQRRGFPYSVSKLALDRIEQKQ